jgi:gliding motility-associated-like protein
MKGIKNIWFNGVMIFLALPWIGLTAQTDTLCFNDTVLYAMPGPKSQGYEWTISGGSIIYLSSDKDSVIVVWNKSTGLHAVEVVGFSGNNCVSEPERLEVYVYEPAADLGGDRAICEDSNELLAVAPDYEEYFWNGRRGTHEYVIETEGSIVLEVKDKYGCWAGDSISVLEINKPQPEFKVNIDPLNRSVSLSNLTDSSWQYSWEFGDGTSSDEYNPGNHTYSNPGTYQITLSATTRGCSGTISEVVQITESLRADFIAVFEGCAPVDITFINQSAAAETYYWDFGNGQSSTDEAPVIRYSEPGIYEVSLTAKKDSLVSISKKSIILHEAPIADFDIFPSETYTYKVIDFMNKSADGLTYLWDFGDGETSESYEPIHSYTSEGLYDVSLSVWSGAGCFDSLLIPDAVTVKQACRILFPNGFIPNKNGSGGGYTDPGQKTDNNEVFHPIYENLDGYELKIFSRWGELIFISTDIEIGWDGYYKGKLAPQDTYIYNAKATCLTGKEISAAGSVTLIY